MERIATAGNIEAPIYQMLLEKGFEIKIENKNWIATKDKIEFCAENIIELAGIIYLRENKGQNWKVGDGKIDKFIKFIQTKD